MGSSAAGKGRGAGWLWAAGTAVAPPWWPRAQQVAAARHVPRLCCRQLTPAAVCVPAGAAVSPASCLGWASSGTSAAGENPAPRVLADGKVRMGKVPRGFPRKGGQLQRGCGHRALAGGCHNPWCQPTPSCSHGCQNSLPQSGLLAPLWPGPCRRWHWHPSPCCSLPHPSHSGAERRSRDWGQNHSTGADVAAGSAPCWSCTGIRLQPGSHRCFFLPL